MRHGVERSKSRSPGRRGLSLRTHWESLQSFPGPLTGGVGIILSPKTPPLSTFELHSGLASSVHPQYCKRIDAYASFVDSKVVFSCWIAVICLGLQFKMAIGVAELMSVWGDMANGDGEL